MGGKTKKTLGEHASKCRTKPQLHGSLSLPYRGTQQTQARGQEGAATREPHRERQPRLGRWVDEGLIGMVVRSFSRPKLKIGSSAAVVLPSRR